ncbi:MAG TPA: hypothetical protein VMM56_00965 [Planctomycetaceae bacterium]|nr:hypothetical protein [Planctomycetaceae bacterium]
MVLAQTALGPAVWIGITVLGLSAAYFLGVPLLILATFKMDATPEVVEFDPDRKRPPKDVVGFFQRMHEQLEAIGFERLASVIVPSPAPNVRAVLALYVNRHKQDAALVTAMWGLADGAPPLHTRYVEFMSEFRDGPLEQLLTNNNDEINAFAENPSMPTFRMPHISKMDRLYRYHQALLRREAPESPKKLTVLDDYNGDVCGYLSVGVLREGFKRQIPTGYLKYDQTQKVFKATVWGAYRMTWKNLPPIKNFIQARYRSSGIRLENELKNSV